MSVEFCILCGMSSIVFLETEPADCTLVQQVLPQATCLPGTIQTAAKEPTVQQAEVLCGFIYSQFNAATLKTLPNLKLLCTRSVGVDHIDLEECAKRGITVCNVPDYGSHVIAEHVFALLLSTIRHIPLADKQTEAGTFDYHGLRGMALRNKTLGIVGTGKIGSAVAQIAHGFGMQCLAVDQCRALHLEQDYGVQYVTLSQLLQHSDIITLHIPATDDTNHFLNTKEFAAMKDGVIIVNTARGSLIDTRALLEALNSGKVQYALLDVLEHEQNFAENKAVLEHPKVVTTPHIAFYADDSLRNMFEVSSGSITDWLEGKTPRHTVQPKNLVCDLPKIAV